MRGAAPRCCAAHPEAFGEQKAVGRFEGSGFGLGEDVCGVGDVCEVETLWRADGAAGGAVAGF